MQIVTDTLTHETLRRMAEDLFGGFVKAVVDVERGALALDALLLQEGSRQGRSVGHQHLPRVAGR